MNNKILNQLIDTIEKLGGRCSYYYDDDYKHLDDQRWFRITHNIAHERDLHKERFKTSYSTDVWFGLAYDKISDKICLIFNYRYVPEGNHFLDTEIMHNQECISYMMMQLFKNDKEILQHWIIDRIDFVYKKQHNDNNSFWSTPELECEWIKDPETREYYAQFTKRTTWFDKLNLINNIKI